VTRFVLFLVKVQWIDRKATSSFLVGITIQTALLTLAIWRSSTSQGDALALAVRASLLTCTAIIFLSAMSNVQNEFRYGTVERALLGKVPFSQLLGIRSAASAVVSSPAVVVPFLGAGWRYPQLFVGRMALLVVLVYVFLGTLCYQSTLVLCQFRNPPAAVVWLRLALLLIGLSIVPFPGSTSLTLVFPTGWLQRFAAQTQGSAAVDVLAFLAVTAGWTLLCWLLLHRRTLQAVERSLTDGIDAV
jgi:hypothetical protein